MRLILAILLAFALPASAAQSLINVGAAPNDGTGDPFRTSMIKVNTNFWELYKQFYTNSLLVAGTPTNLLATNWFALTAGTNVVLTTNGSTLVLNASGGGSGTVSGTANTVAKFSGATAVGNSQITDDGTNVGIGVTPSEKFQVAGNLSTYHASAVQDSGYSIWSYTDTTGSLKTNIGYFGIYQSASNTRNGDFRVYNSSGGAPALKFQIRNTGSMGLNVPNPEAIGGAIFHIANPKESKTAADHWSDIGHFSSAVADANPLAISLGIRSSPTRTNRHLFIQATEIEDVVSPLILQPIGGNIGVNTGTNVPSAQLTVTANTNSLGIHINANTNESSLFQFMANDRTTPQGGIRGLPNRIAIIDSDSTDVITITNGRAGIGTVNPLTTLHANGIVTLGAATTVTTGTGSPESVVTAPVGSIFLRTDGGASTTLYVKESGSGNTGWTASGGGGSSGFTNTATAVLTYGATVTPDIDAIPNITRNCPRRVTLTLTLTGNVTTLNVPTATPIHGDEVKFEFIQDNVGYRTVAFSSGYRTGTGLTGVNISTNAAWTDWATFTYTTNAGKWDLLGNAWGLH